MPGTGSPFGDGANMRNPRPYHRTWVSSCVQNPWYSRRSGAGDRGVGVPGDRPANIGSRIHSGMGRGPLPVSTRHGMRTIGLTNTWVARCNDGRPAACPAVIARSGVDPGNSGDSQDTVPVPP